MLWRCVAACRYATDTDREFGNSPFIWRSQSGPLRVLVPQHMSRHNAMMGLGVERRQARIADFNWAFGPVTSTLAVSNSAIPVADEFVGAPVSSVGSRPTSPSLPTISEAVSPVGDAGTAGSDAASDVATVLSSPDRAETPTIVYAPPVITPALTPSQSFAGWGQHVVVLGDDDTIVKAGSWDGAVHCISLSSGELLQRLRYHTKPVRCVASSEDGQVVVLGSEDCTLTLWRAVPPVGGYSDDSAAGSSGSGTTAAGGDIGGSSSGFTAVMDDFEGVRRSLGVYEDDNLLDVQAQLESSVSVGGGIDVNSVMAARREQHQRRLLHKGSIGFPALQAAASKFQSELLYGAVSGAQVAVPPQTPFSVVGAGFGDALVKMFRGAARQREYKPILQGHIAGGGPLMTLFGHTAPVTCVAVSQSLGVVVSGSDVCLVHRLKDGALIRQLDPWSALESNGSGASPLVPVPNCWAFLEAKLGVRGFSRGIPISRVAIVPDGQVVLAAHKRLALFSSR